MNPDAILRLRSVYERLDSEVDALLAGTALRPFRATDGAVLRSLGEGGRAEGPCRACGECCTFPPGAPVLYATALERSYLAAEPPPEQQQQSGLPEGACPHLDMATNLCTARERRTIGCRTHFCEKALPSPDAREAVRALSERALGEVRSIAEDFAIAWDYAPVVEAVDGHG